MGLSPGRSTPSLPGRTKGCLERLLRHFRPQETLASSHTLHCGGRRVWVDPLRPSESGDEVGSGRQVLPFVVVGSGPSSLFSDFIAYMCSRNSFRSIVVMSSDLPPGDGPLGWGPSGNLYPTPPLPKDAEGPKSLVLWFLRF